MHTNEYAILNLCTYIHTGAHRDTLTTVSDANPPTCLSSSGGRNDDARLGVDVFRTCWTDGSQRWLARPSVQQVRRHKDGREPSERPGFMGIFALPPTQRVVSDIEESLEHIIGGIMMLRKLAGCGLFAWTLSL